MITYASEPWKKKGVFTQHKNAFASSILLITLFFSYVSLLFVADAKAQDFSQCSSVVLIGDIHGVGVKGAGFENSIRDKGAKNVSSYVYKGKRVSEITEDMKNVNTKDACLIVEAGSGSAGSDQTDESLDKEIDGLIKQASDANKVFWVTPVASDQSKSWGERTKRFNNHLNKKLVGKDKFSIINIQNYALDEELFKDNGIVMTDEGYKKRSGDIIKALEIGLKKDTPTSTSSPSTNDPAPAPGNPGSGGSAGGGDESSGSDLDAEIGGDNPEGDSDVAPNESEDQKSSPKAFALKAKAITNPHEASKYLMVSRWGTPSVPLRELDATEPETVLGFSQGQFAEFFLMISHFIMSIGFFLTSMAFNDFIASISLKAADSLYGNFFGLDGDLFGINGGGNNVVMSLVSIIVTITISMAIIRALSPRNGFMIKDRMMIILGATIRVSLIMSFFIFSGTASRNNGEEVSEAYFDEVIDVFANGRADSEQANSNNFFANNKIDLKHLDTVEKEIAMESVWGEDFDAKSRQINAPGSWVPFSLGWMVSLIYQFSQFVGSAIARGFALFINAPIDLWKSSTHADGRDDSERNGTVCERYIDSMHLTYSYTRAMRNDAASQVALRAFDLIYLDLIIRPYSHIYGGATASSKNSWCWNLELNSGVNAGEWAMLARGAGAYGYALGTGDLFTGQNMFANGNHGLADMNMNLETVESVAAGKIVTANGDWAGGDADDKGLDRGETFMGYGRGKLGRSQAKYYFAACHFKVGTGNTPTIRQEWKGVRAAGPSGGVAGMTKEQSKKVVEKFDVASSTSLEDNDCVVPIDKLREDGAQEKATGGIGQKGNEEVTGSGEDGTVVDENGEAIIENANKNGGFGDINTKGYPANYVYRWNYDKLPSESWNLLSSANIPLVGESSEDKKIEKSVKKLYGDGINIGDYPKAWIPDTKFHGNATAPPSGYQNKAKEFWNYTNGIKGTSTSLSLSLLVSLAVILFVFLATPLLIVAALFSFLFSLLMVFVPFAIGANLLIYAFRGGSKELI